uniref:hypothetical protein n=1 Tax=Ligilactobacillus aviarius TaxID=1606 RepID=UPI000A60DB76|nr:hypothetical protein [Ligilactobacillus aviarius]
MFSNDCELEGLDECPILFCFGSLSNRIGEELLGEALTVVTQLMLLFDLREKYNQCD